MFVPHRKHTYGSPGLVTGIALLLQCAYKFLVSTCRGNGIVFGHRKQILKFSPTIRRLGSPVTIVFSESVSCTMKTKVECYIETSEHPRLQERPSQETKLQFVFFERDIFTMKTEAEYYLETSEHTRLQFNPLFCHFHKLRKRSAPPRLCCSRIPSTANAATATFENLFADKRKSFRGGKGFPQ
jgi:hypothetical protein